MSKQLRLDVAQLTDVGRKRPHNEDNMAYVIPKDAQVMARKGALFVVADGMGGHAAGEVASEIAVETISNAYYQQDDNEDITVSLLHAIKRANALIHQRAAENMMRSGMGTTCVAAVLRGSTAYIANVGDSRAYLVRAGQARQVSQDHSWVEEQVRAGLLTRDQARSHAQRNVITRSLGTQDDVDVDVFTEQLFEGDTLLLCSDGLSGLVSDEDLRSIIGQYLPQESVYRLVERANENGGPDNITAIVIRVLEPGWEPYPVPVGSREAIAESVTLGRVPSASLTMSSPIDEAMTQPIPPARLSEPLPVQENFSSPRPAFVPPPAKSQRLLWPIFAILALLVLALLGGGLYYFLRPILFPTVSVDQSLLKANTQITQAKNDLGSNNAVDALKMLALAQKELRAVQQAGSLSDTQTQSLHQLQNDLVTTVQTSITSYNQQELISTCATNMTSSPVNAGNTNTQAASIAAIQDGSGKVYRYIVGDDHNLYQLDAGLNLVNKQNLPGNAQALMLIGAQDHVLALTAVSKGNNAPSNYSLNLLTPNGSGGLDSKNTVALDTYTKGGQQPALLTAWTTDSYVIFTSQSTPNTVTVLNIPEANNKFGTPHATQLSVTSSIVSMAAFPNHQLFLLNTSGNVQSLQFADNSQASSVLVQHPIATPLPISAKSFSLKVDVPAPGPQTSSFLSIPDASHAVFLAAGQINNKAQLYVVDSIYHRVLALQLPQSLAIATPTSTASKKPTQTSTGASNVESGAVSATPVTMVLVQQYVSSDALTTVKSVAANPKLPTLNLLTTNGQNPAGTNLLAVDISMQNACNP